ncbi:hypothetical protein LCGC14_3153200 [marine sediment metagenome]|uniref:Uncharacterized protein n=1 Tax=marine sediment metagenome TaxID=412755 RepID=A0A0F8WHI5_9ZZZZ
MKTSSAERDYHKRRAIALAKYNDERPEGTPRARTLRDAGLSLAVNGGAKPKALVESANQTVARAKKVGLKIHEEVPKAKPKRKSRAKAKDGPLGQKNGQPSEGA